MTRRVVVTGMGVASPIGNDPQALLAALRAGRTGVVTLPEWGEYGGLRTRLGGAVTDLPLRYPRKKVRTMGRVAKLALHATEQALASAGLDPERVASGACGIAYGSTHGSSSAMGESMGRLFREHTFEGLVSSAFFKFMSHTVAANLAIYFGVRGRIYTTCSACTSGSQGIGYGYDAIRHGHHDVMICGGAEELHPIHAGVFDVMFATATRDNDAPERAPRPYDADRDGLVVGEGAGTLILESLDHARERGAPILAEIVGYGTNCDGAHAAAPSEDGMAGAIALALSDAGVDPGEIDYVNGHGTATDLGDVAETRATRRVFGRAVPISSTKSFMGHTLGACGAIESIICLLALRHGFVPATRTLARVDPRCADLDYVTAPREVPVRLAMNNNFAFGGINTSLIFRQP